MSRRKAAAVPFTLFAFQDIITSVTGIMLLVTLLMMLDLLTQTERSAPVVTKQVTSEIQAAATADQQELSRLRERLQSIELDPGITEADIARQLQDAERALALTADDRKRIQPLVEATNESAQAIQKKKEAKSISVERLESLQKKLAEGRADIDKLKLRNRVIFHPAQGSTKQAWLIQLEQASASVGKVGEPAPPQTFNSRSDLLEWAGRRSPRSDYFVLLVKPSGISQFDEVKTRFDELGFEVGFDLLADDQTALDPETGAGVNEP